MKIKHILLFIASIILLLACQETQNPSTGLYDLGKLPTYFGGYTIPEDNLLSYKGIELGKMLFYEKQLSADNTISCASCHQQKLAFTDGLGQSVGFQNRKREVGSMSLANLLWQNRFNWTGNANVLEQQVFLQKCNPKLCK